MYGHKCPVCGSYLDPCEQCDCEEKAAPSGANTEDGNANNDSDSVSQKASLCND